MYLLLCDNMSGGECGEQADVERVALESPVEIDSVLVTTAAGEPVLYARIVMERERGGEQYTVVEERFLSASTGIARRRCETPDGETVTCTEQVY